MDKFSDAVGRSVAEREKPFGLRLADAARNAE